MNEGLRTNRDLYSYVTDLVKTLDKPRPLEEYLRSLDGLLSKHASRSELTAEELASLLTEATTAPAPPYDPAWASLGDASAATGFEGVRHTLRRQVVDLRELEASGGLKDPQRYFGLDAPRGSRWYNFEVASYLECGVQGSFGGWDPEAGSDGRILVPGKVAVLDDEGRMTAVDAADLKHPEVPVTSITWDDVQELLWAGQNYE